jgi:hypothetical protein
LRPQKKNTCFVSGAGFSIGLFDWAQSPPYENSF